MQMHNNALCSDNLIHILPHKPTAQDQGLWIDNNIYFI